MQLRDLVFVLPVAILVPACATAPHDAGHADASAENAKPAAVAATDTKPAAKEEAAGEEKETKAEKLAKKNRDLEDAKFELKITRQECESEQRKNKDEVEEAERELRVATDDRDNYVKVEMPLDLAKDKLSVDRSANGLEQERQNLAELESMYKKNETAKLTQELVLMRHRKQIEFGVRDLEHAQASAARKSEFEMPKKQHELEARVLKAEHTLREARAKKTRVDDEVELKQRKREHSIDDLEKEIAKIKAQPDKPAPKPEPKPEPKKDEKPQAKAGGS